MENQDLLILALSICLITAIGLYRRLQKEKRAGELLKIEKAFLEKRNLQLQAEHLKFRLQPHTVNNILANLKAIANKLNRGMDSLSGTLDYILYKGDAHLVSVESELDFMKRYLALNDLFLSEIDSVRVNDSQVDSRSKNYREPRIPHLISAYFLENAFKHGDVNHPEFLEIRVLLTDLVFEMHVVNKIKKFNMRTQSGGIGQRNMKDRLELLLPGKYDMKFSCNEQEYHSMLKIALT